MTTRTPSRSAETADSRKRSIRELKREHNEYRKDRLTHEGGEYEEVSFVIVGNPTHEAGNPMGYKRTLNGGRWTSESTRYSEWKSHVRASYMDVPGLPAHLKMRWYDDMPVKMKGKCAWIDVAISFVDDRRGDGDNVLKGIEDALFDNDKNVLRGSFRTELRQPIGMVKVVIRIFDMRDAGSF